MDADTKPEVDNAEQPAAPAEPERPRIPEAAFSLGEESDLLWYFGAAQAALERSTSGGTFERQGRYSPAQIKAAGYEYGRPAMEPVYSTDGEHIIGQRSSLSAQITNEDNAPSGFSPDERAMERFAVVSRRVLALGRQPDGAQHIAVVQAYFGDAGNRWARIDVDATDPRTTDKGLRSMRGHGRLAALYALTSAGQRLLRWSAEQDRKAGRADLGLPEQARMENEVAASSRSDVRKALVISAAKQARELLGLAWAAWRATEE
jgi:hypothetical protein